MVAHLVEGGRRAARTSFLLFSVCHLPYEIFHFLFAIRHTHFISFLIVVLLTPSQHKQERPASYTVMPNFQCAAKHLCGMPTIPILAGHHCMTCGEKTHGAGTCGVFWCERGDDVCIPIENLSERGQGFYNSNSAIMCYSCVGRLNTADNCPTLSLPQAKDKLPSTTAGVTAQSLAASSVARTSILLEGMLIATFHNISSVSILTYHSISCTFNHSCCFFIKIWCIRRGFFELSIQAKGCCWSRPSTQETKGPCALRPLHYQGSPLWGGICRMQVLSVIQQEEPSKVQPVKGTQSFH